MAQADWITYGTPGGAKAAQIEQLRKLFANIGAISDSGRVIGGERWVDGGDSGPGGYSNPYTGGFNQNFANQLLQMGLFADRFKKGGLEAYQSGAMDPSQLFSQGWYDLNPVYGNAVYDNIFEGDNGYQQVLREWGDPTGYTFTMPEMADPEREGKKGAYTLTFNPDGTIADVTWQNYDLSKGFFGDNMSWLGPLLVGGLAALGSTAGAAAGAAGTSSASSGLSAEIMREIAYGAIGELPGYGAGVAATAGSLGSELSRELAYGAIGEAPGYGVQLPAAAQTGAAAGGGQSLVTRALEAGKAIAPYAQLAGPAMSLLSGGAQLGLLPQQPADAPRLPGLEAPPEARGWQAGVAPILDVLGRNKREGRDRTLLTGPRGVNMASTRARGNTLLGL